MNFEFDQNAKSFYKFNEIASLVEVKPYVLRFWESEFEQIKPTIDPTGHKVYGLDDFMAIKKIKALLFEEKLSIPQAKSELDKLLQAQPEKDSTSSVENNNQVSNQNVTSQKSSLELMKSALAVDLKFKTEELVQKQFNDQDVLRIVQAKRKLNGILAKLDSIIVDRNW